MLVWLAVWTTVFFVHSANALPGIAAFGVALFRRPPFADEVSEGEFKRRMLVDLALILGYMLLASLAVWLFFTTYSDSPRYIQLLWYLGVAVVAAAYVAWHVKGRRRIL